MENQEIHKRIKAILACNKITKKPVEEIGLQDHFINDLDIDSIGIVTALTALEKEFNLDIPPEDFTLENFATIDLITNYLQKKFDKDGN